MNEKSLIEPTNLTLFTSIVLAEQNNYWIRFTAFSALHAALIVLVISNKVSSYVGFVGLMLAFVWAVIQYASYRYVIYYDKIWEPLIKEIGIRDSADTFWNFLPRTTLMGVFATFLIVLFWLFFCADKINAVP